MISDSSVNLNLQDTGVCLMLAVQRDDASAFEKLMLHYQNRVFSLLRHMIGNRDTAEDLTQEVFLRVFRARKNYQPEAKFTTWLFTITNNVANNALRTRLRKPEVQLGIAKNEEEPNSQKHLAENLILASSGTIPARQLDKLEMKEMVQLAVASLGERQRKAILYHKFEGMNYQEIAKVMEMTPQGVKSLLCRARLNLRDALQGYIQRGKKVKDS
jgi:RNA polymerase sigma-70 factor (ECF subfamily)